MPVMSGIELLQRRVEEATQHLTAAYQELEATYGTTLEALGSALDTRDIGTESHSRRVHGYALATAKEYGVPQEIVRDLAHGVLLHGIGYPRGLSGADIPLGARIFAVVDAFDAMTFDRPYSKAIAVEAAQAEIKRCAGTHFDPEVVEAFVRVPAPLLDEIRRRSVEP